MIRRIGWSVFQRCRHRSQEVFLEFIQNVTQSSQQNTTLCVNFVAKLPSDSDLLSFIPMPGFSLGLAIVLLLVFGAEFVNGWTDAPNAIATVVPTRCLSPFQAVCIASALNLAGVLSGTPVAETFPSCAQTGTREILLIRVGRTLPFQVLGIARSRIFQVRRWHP